MDRKMALIANIARLAQNLHSSAFEGRYRGRAYEELATVEALLVDASNLIGHDGPASHSPEAVAFYAEEL